MESNIRLSRQDKQVIKALMRRGREHVRVVRRAQILWLAHQGYKRQAIKDSTGASIPTINRTKRWYREVGLEAAIYDGKRTGRPRKLNSKTQAIILATACSKPPEGYSRWTYELIAAHAPLDERISGESIRLMMNANGIKPWREKNVVHS